MELGAQASATSYHPNMVLPVRQNAFFEEEEQPPQSPKLPDLPDLPRRPAVEPTVEPIVKFVKKISSKKNHNTPAEFARSIASQLIIRKAKEEGYNLDEDYPQKTQMHCSLHQAYGVDNRINRCISKQKKLTGKPMILKTAAKWGISLPPYDEIRNLFRPGMKASYYTKADFLRLKFIIPEETWKVPELPQ